MNFGKGHLFCDFNDIDRTYKIANALASPVRLRIIKLLIHKSMSIGELSNELHVSISSISMHTAILKEAGLISIATKPGKHGTYKVCGIYAERIVFDFFESMKKTLYKTTSWNIPVGMYSIADIHPPCGIVNSEGYFEKEDEPYGFFHPLHSTAGLIWFTHGELTYNISNKLFHEAIVKSISISFEICAEAPGYNNEWPSDIFLKINDKKIHVFTVAGDYGGKRGINNPAWWLNSNTQFGELREIVIKDDGIYFDNVKISQENFDTLNIRSDYSFTFSIGVDKNAVHPGGLNLFGKNFGNFNQDIKVEVLYVLN